MASDKPIEPVIDAELHAAIIWFEGYPEGSDYFGRAIVAGGFFEPESAGRGAHVHPAALEIPRRQHGEIVGWALYPRRVGVDMRRRAFVIEVDDAGAGAVVLLPIDAAAAALNVARIANGQQAV